MFFTTAISHLLQIKSKSTITKQAIKNHKQPTNPNTETQFKQGKAAGHMD